MLKKTKFDFIKGQGDYQLLPVEFFKEQIPFEVKRTYFVLSNDKETLTGQHAHYEEEEVFLLLKGGAKLISLDKDNQEYSITLKPGEAVYVPKMVWHGFVNLLPDTVIAAFSSTHHKHDRSDYLENRDVYFSKYLSA